ncbi:MAG: hypothetical protein IJO70_05325 [Lachnospiraceae bacterium]|nr:hypothetical protein [Lachnospiraceae bacterium]
MKTIKRTKKIFAIMMCMVMLLGFTVIASAETTPRLIISGYTTDKDEIKSGDTFEMTISIQNVSKKSDISNIKVTLSTANNEIVPASGSNTMYIEKIAKEEIYELKVTMEAGADLASKPYVMDVKFSYEDRYGTPIEDATTLVIPVIQNQRVSVGSLDVQSQAIMVGDETDVSFTVNNQGRGEIFNVNAKIVGEGIEATEAFVGNVASGGMGYVDITVTATDYETATGTVQAIITFEDSVGNESQITQDIALEVFEYVEPVEDFSDVTVTPEAPSHISPVVIIAVVVLVIVLVVVIKKRKQKKEEEQDEI